MILSIPIVTCLALPLGEDPAWTQARLEAASARIQTQVEELRGEKFVRAVGVKMSDTASLRAYIQKREAETTSPGRTHRDECSAKLLGLVAPGLDLRALELEVLESQVGGFYDPSSDTFFLMDQMKGTGAKVILAHEFTHALDDQLYDLDKILKTANEETDSELALRSVIEGSGMNLMTRWATAHTDEYSIADLMSLQSMGADVLRKAPPLVWKPLLGTYTAGDAFLAHAAGAKAKVVASADIGRAFRDPPRSTEQILHPELYWDAAKRDDPARVHFDVAALPKGWTELAQDTLGELALALVTTPVADRKGFDVANPFAALGLKFTNEPAKGWGGDRLILLGRGDDRFLQLVTVWDSTKDAGEFAAAITAAAPKLHTGPRDAAAGWVARFTPTHFDVRTPTNVRSPVFVVVRAASITAADDAGFATLEVPWSSNSAGKSGERGPGNEPGGSAEDSR